MVRLPRMLVAAALLAAAGCSVILGIDGDVVDPKPDGGGAEAGALVLTSDVATIALRQGASAMISVTAKPSTGTSRLVQVTASGLPPSITAPTLSLMEGETKPLVLTADDVALVGDHPFTVQGTTGDVTSSAITLTARVSGNVDPTFGDAGVAFVPFGPLVGSADGEPIGLAIDSEGRILVAFGIGGVVDGGAITVRPVAVARLTPDGNLDETFGDAGYATAAIDGGPSPNQRAQGVVLTPDGTLIVVGKSLEPGTKVEGVVVAFDPNGALLGGEKVDASTSSTVYAGAAVESALSVIAVGEADNGLVSRIDVLDGVLDPSYGDGGLGNVEGKDKKPTTCHDVLVMGSRTLVTCRAGSLFDLIALQPDSTLDTTFGTNGSALAPNPPSGSQEPWTTIASASGARLLEVGASLPAVPQPHGVAVRALLSNGAADPTFADGGVATYVPQRQGSTGAQAFTAVATDAGLWMGGAIELDNDRRGLVMRIDESTGAIDGTFAADGVSSPTWAGNLLVVRKLAVQGDRVIAAAIVGKSVGASTSLDVVLFRYVP